MEGPGLHTRITDDLEVLLEALPPHITNPIRNDPERHDLLEVVMDLGRVSVARYPEREVVLSSGEVSEADLQHVTARIGEFGDDNRAGIERTLHRIACIRNRRGRIVGLTCRVGRAVYGTIRIIEDLVFSGHSILLLGRPGVGKTTMLREVARVLADDAHKRVVVVDTSNEIAGDGDIPHPAIGTARRMQVPTPRQQHAVMIEAVENHMPEVIIIDEIGTELEAAAARTIAERGVQLVATAHGNTLENLLMNPTLSDLIGGIQSVTLGDEEARRRGTQKSILERKAPPTFDILVEIQTWTRVAVHQDVADTVDAALRGFPIRPEIRELGPDGVVAKTVIAELPWERERLGAAPPSIRAAAAKPAAAAFPEGSERRILSFGISRGRLEQAIRRLQAPAAVVEALEDADTVMTLRSHYRRRPQLLREAEGRGIPIYVLRNNTLYQMEQSLLSLFGADRGPEAVMRALQEAEEAVGRVQGGAPAVDLAPQSAYIRRLQHELAQRFALASESSGREPFRRVRVFSAGASRLPSQAPRDDGS